MNKNANLEAKSDNGWTVLHYASESSSMDIAKYLIEEKHFGE